MNTILLWSRVIGRSYYINTFQASLQGITKRPPRCRSCTSVSSNKKLLNLLTEMPKDMKHIEMLQKQRQQKKLSKTTYPPGTVRLQVLGTGARGAARALYIFTDQKW